MTTILRAVGDILMGLEPPVWEDSRFAALTDLMGSADLAFGNMEAPMTDSGLPLSKLDLARADTVRADDLKRIGFNVVSLANNHITDYGRKGLESTVETLNRVGIAHCGAGLEASQAFSPVFVESNGKRFAFVAFHAFYFPGGEHYTDVIQAEVEVPGAAVIRGFQVRVPDGRGGQVVVAPEERFLQMLLQSIRTAKEQSDFVVVSMHSHFGMDCATSVDPARTMIAHAAVDAGANLIVGHGPHALNGIEYYGGAFIAHSLGNFFFYQAPDEVGRLFFPDAQRIFGTYAANERYWQAALLEADFSKGAPSELILHPMQITPDPPCEGMPQLANEQQAEAIFTSIAEQSREMNVNLQQGEDGRIVVTPASP